MADKMTAQQEETADAISRLPLAMVLSDPGLDDNPLVYVNEAFEKLTLYSREYAVGRNCRFLQCEETDPDDVAELRRRIAEGEDVALDLLNAKADGTRFLNRLLISPIQDDRGDVIAYLGVQREIGGPEGPRHDPDGEIPARASQDVLLAEVQHRVKNHLAMIVSLIRLQASRSVTKESFEALSQRVQALALLYDELSGSGLARTGDREVPAGAYLSRVASAVAAIDGRKAVRVNVECEEIDLPVDQTARLGLLLTEFLTNALEHAFDGREEGVVRVRFQRLSQGAVRLVVEDDGIGLPEETNWPYDSAQLEDQKERVEEEDDTVDTRGKGGQPGLGGSIVVALVRSLSATLDVNSKTAGTCVTLDLEAGAPTGE